MNLTFVAGCARSGTSLTTGVIGALGAKLGNVNRLNEINAIRDGIIKPYLQSMGCDKLGQYPLADRANLKPFPDFRERVLKAMGGAEVYKCAKSPAIWPLFAEHFPEAKWVIVRRHKADIIDSCHRAPFMRNHPDWGEWVDFHLECFEEMKATLDCIEVWPFKAIMGDLRDYEDMAEFLGLPFNEDVVRRQINPGKWHGKGK